MKRLLKPSNAKKSGALACFNGTVVLPDRLLKDGVVVCRDGRISTVGSREDVAIPRGAERVDARGGFIAPGFIDIHVHGGGGADFMDGTAQAVATALRTHAGHGTTTIFPTTTTGTPKQIERMVRACLQVRESQAAGDGARIEGVHLYGPYFAENMRGAHPEGHARSPDPAEFLGLFDLDIIRVATCAAELPGAGEFYREASRRGCLVTCGHSNATWGEMERAFDAGMRHVDHFWCAMSSVKSLRQRFDGLEMPMQASMEQFVLDHEEMSTEVIADGWHLSPELLRFAYRFKGAERLCLVTDSSRAVDMPPGRYKIGPTRGGTPCLSNGRVLYRKPGFRPSSSVVGMDTMVRNFHTMTGVGLAETVRMASLTPAERVGMDGEIGSLARGKRADVLLLDGDLAVRRVFIGGREFKRNP